MLVCAYWRCKFLHKPFVNGNLTLLCESRGPSCLIAERVSYRENLNIVRIVFAAFEPVLFISHNSGLPGTRGGRAGAAKGGGVSFSRCSEIDSP